MAVAMRIAPTCGGPSYVQTVSCMSGRQSRPPDQRAREQFGEVAGLLVALDGREDEFDRPFGGDALRLQRIGKAETADHEIGPRIAAAVELTVDVLSFAEE